MMAAAEPSLVDLFAGDVSRKSASGYQPPLGELDVEVEAEPACRLSSSASTAIGWMGP